MTQIYRDFRLILRVIIAQQGGAAGQSGSAQLIMRCIRQYHLDDSANYHHWSLCTRFGKKFHDTNFICLSFIRAIPIHDQNCNKREGR